MPVVPSGVIELLEFEAGEVPAVFVAVTVNVYAVPFVRPVKVHDVETVPMHPAGALTAGDEVTV